MEEHDEKQSSPLSGQVMDVTAPQPSSTEESNTQNIPTISENDSSTIQTPIHPSTESSLGELAIDKSAPNTEPRPDVSQTESANEQSPLGIHEHPEHQNTSSHHAMPVMAIVVAIFVAIVLAGLVVMAYVRKNNGDIERKDTTTSSQSTETKTDVRTSDVDETSKQVDDTLAKANDAVDFPEAELSDASLGL